MPQTHLRLQPRAVNSVSCVACAVPTSLAQASIIVSHAALVAVHAYTTYIRLLALHTWPRVWSLPGSSSLQPGEVISLMASPRKVHANCRGRRHTAPGRF